MNSRRNWSVRRATSTETFLCSLQEWSVALFSGKPFDIFTIEAFFAVVVSGVVIFVMLFFVKSRGIIQKMRDFM
jgi:hypothetical protein